MGLVKGIGRKPKKHCRFFTGKGNNPIITCIEAQNGIKSIMFQLLHEPVLSLNTKQRSRSVWTSLETGLSSQINIRFCLLSFSLESLLVWIRMYKTLHKYKRARFSFHLCDCLHSARLRQVCIDAQDQLSLRLSPM